MSYRVSFRSGTGHDDHDEEYGLGEHGRPTEFEFATEAERQAFILGVNEALNATEGWTDAWVELEVL